MSSLYSDLVHRNSLSIHEYVYKHSKLLGFSSKLQEVIPSDCLFCILIGLHSWLQQDKLVCRLDSRRFSASEGLDLPDYVQPKRRHMQIENRLELWSPLCSSVTH